MADPGENPKARTIVRQTFALYREAMRMAALVLRAEEPITWEDREQKERYYTYAPIIGGQIYHDLLQNSAFIEQATDKDHESRFESVDTITTEAARLNDEQENGTKAK